MTCKDDGSLRCLQYFYGATDLRWRGSTIIHLRSRQWPKLWRHRHLFKILRDTNVARPRTFCLRNLERLSHHFRHSAGNLYFCCPFRYRLEHAHEINKLMCFLVLAVKADLCADSKQGDTVCMGVCGSQQQVDGSRSQRPSAYPSRPSNAAVHVRHERARLLVTN